LTRYEMIEGKLYIYKRMILFHRKVRITILKSITNSMWVSHIKTNTIP